MASFRLRTPALASKGRLLARALADAVRRNWIVLPKAVRPQSTQATPIVAIGANDGVTKSGLNYSCLGAVIPASMFPERTC